MRLYSGSVVVLHTVCGKLYVDGKLWNPAAVGEKHKENEIGKPEVSQGRTRSV